MKFRSMRDWSPLNQARADSRDGWRHAKRMAEKLVEANRKLAFATTQIHSNDHLRREVEILLSEFAWKWERSRQHDGTQLRTYHQFVDEFMILATRGRTEGIEQARSS